MVMGQGSMLGEEGSSALAVPERTCGRPEGIICSRLRGMDSCQVISGLEGDSATEGLGYGPRPKGLRALTRPTVSNI
jgi:hypothetical protein